MWFKHWLHRLLSMIRDFPYSKGRLINGRYAVSRLIGSGSYGHSYLCVDRKSGHTVVVKQLKPSKADHPVVRQLFEYEQELLTRLRHPSIPRCRDQFIWNGHRFIAMDYVEGHNLEELIFAHGVQFDEIQALRLTDKLLELVSYLHGSGIVHRDIRVPNVILHDGELTLVDFGLARDLHASQVDLELEPDDPEEKKLRRRPDISSDYYAIGHFLLFLLYSSYEPQTDAEAERSWEEELTLSVGTVKLLRRLLFLDSPYTDFAELRDDLRRALTSLSSE